MSKYAIIGKTYFSAPNNNIDYKKFSILEMKKRGEILKEYNFRFLAEAKYKNDFATEHNILREKDNTISLDEKYKELYDIIESFSKLDYICWRNPLSKQSIPLLMHYHFAKFMDMDKEIEKLL